MQSFEHYLDKISSKDVAEHICASLHYYDKRKGYHCALIELQRCTKKEMRIISEIENVAEFSLRKTNSDKERSRSISHPLIVPH